MAQSKSLDLAKQQRRRDAKLIQELPEEFFELMERRYGFVAFTGANTEFEAGTKYGRLTVFSEIMSLFKHKEQEDE